MDDYEDGVERSLEEKIRMAMQSCRTSAGSGSHGSESEVDETVDHEYTGPGHGMLSSAEEDDLNLNGSPYASLSPLPTEESLDRPQAKKPWSPSQHAPPRGHRGRHGSPTGSEDHYEEVGSRREPRSLWSPKEMDDREMKMIRGGKVGKEGSPLNKYTSVLETPPSKRKSLQTPSRRRSSGSGRPSSSGSAMAGINLDLLTIDTLPRGQDAAQLAMQKLVDELRKVKKERDMYAKVAVTDVEQAISQTRQQMDEDFRLVVKAMVDEKHRTIHAANNRVAFLESQLALERNRVGMALAEVESLHAERRVDIPRDTCGTRKEKQTTGAFMPKLTYVRPDTERHQSRIPNHPLNNRLNKSDARQVHEEYVFSANENNHEVEQDDEDEGDEPIDQPEPTEIEDVDDEEESQQEPDEFGFKRIGKQDAKNESSKFQSPRYKEPAKVIYDALLEAQPSTEGEYVLTRRIRTFLRQSELLPPNMLVADLDVLLTKHAKRKPYLTKEQFADILADVALGLLQAGIITVDDGDKRLEQQGEAWEWGVHPPKTVVTKASALLALGRILFPPNED